MIMCGAGACPGGCTRITPERRWRVHRGRPGLGQGRWGYQACQPLLLRPDCRNPLLIFGTNSWRRRMVHRRRLVPVTGLRKQFLEELCRVTRIGDRIERHLQVGEGVRMVHQIDLCASDIDRSDAAGLHGPYSGDRLSLRLVDEALAFGVRTPRPGVYRS